MVCVKSIIGSSPLIAAKIKIMEKVHNVPKYQGGILISDFLKESELITLYYDYVNNFLTLTNAKRTYGS